MKKEGKEDYRLRVTISKDRSHVRNVLCKIYLPFKSADPVRLQLLPSRSQYIKLETLDEFKVSGLIKRISGDIRGRIEATQAYILKASRDQIGVIEETQFVAAPTTLTITESLSNQSPSGVGQVKGSFWLTPNMLLSPAIMRHHHYTGEVKIEEARKFQFRLRQGIPLTFTNHYRYSDGDNDSEITYPELVAEFTFPRRHGYFSKIQSKVLPELDDFLLICSFASRQKCVCVGWQASVPGKWIRHYRRGIRIPSSKKGSIRNVLIDLPDFEAFALHVYKTLSSMSAQYKTALRQSLQYTIPREDRTLENSFMTLYSALETLVAYTAHTTGAGSIFSPNEWKEMRSDLKSFLHTHKHLKSSKEKRGLIYEKLSELNRVSFKTAFSRLCKLYSVGLDDLWPTVDNSDGISLSEIRNKLIHGGTFSDAQGYALIAAREHLQWTVERLLLAFFGWPVSRSNVSDKFLSENLAIYKNWQSDRLVLSH